jgi:hypothetical protein
MILGRLKRFVQLLRSKSTSFSRNWIHGGTTFRVVQNWRFNLKIW